jgi:N-acyl-D-aspartate/D-glutamate deacylase
VRTGFKADLVVFDERRVRPAMPTVETDLSGLGFPAGCGATLMRDVTPRA